MTLREYLEWHTTHVQEWDEVMNPDVRTEWYWKGRTTEAEDILKELPHLDHTVTFREVVELCNQNDCDNCLLKGWCKTVPNSWFMARCPCNTIDINAVEREYIRRIKEKENGKNKENNN